jgi:hypothetical protein
VVRFVLLIFYIGLVQWWDLFCILNLCDIVQLFCILNLCGIVELFCILNLCDIVQLFKQWKNKKQQPCPHTSKHLNTTIHPKESPKICSYVPPYTTCHHRTFEYNHQPQGVPKKICSYVPPYTTCHHRTLEYNHQSQGVPKNM